MSETMDEQQPLKKRLREEGGSNFSLGRFVLEHCGCHVIKFEVERLQTWVEEGKAVPIKYDGFRVRSLYVPRFSEGFKVSCMTASVTPSYGFQKAADMNFYFFQHKDEVVRGKLEAAIIRHLVPSVQRAWRANENEKTSVMYLSDIPSAIILDGCVGPRPRITCS